MSLGSLRVWGSFSWNAAPTMAQSSLIEDGRLRRERHPAISPVPAMPSAQPALKLNAATGGWTGKPADDHPANPQNNYTTIRTWNRNLVEAWSQELVRANEAKCSFNCPFRVPGASLPPRHPTHQPTTTASLCWGRVLSHKSHSLESQVMAHCFVSDQRGKWPRQAPLLTAEDTGEKPTFTYYIISSASILESMRWAELRHHLHLWIRKPSLQKAEWLIDTKVTEFV